MTAPVKVNPQVGPAMALTQLLSENPGLPPLRWSLTPEGQLSGNAFDLEDLDGTVKLYVAVLGGEPELSEHVGDDGTWTTAWWFPVWRDVQFFIRLGSTAAPVGLPSDWVAAPAQMITAAGDLFELASIPRVGQPQYVLAGCHNAPPSVFAEYGELVDSFGAVDAAGAA